MCYKQLQLLYLFNKYFFLVKMNDDVEDVSYMYDQEAEDRNPIYSELQTNDKQWFEPFDEKPEHPAALHTDRQPRRIVQHHARREYLTLGLYAHLTGRSFHKESVLAWNMMGEMYYHVRINNPNVASAAAASSSDAEKTSVRNPMTCRQLIDVYVKQEIALQGPLMAENARTSIPYPIYRCLLTLPHNRRLLEKPALESVRRWASDSERNWAGSKDNFHIQLFKVPSLRDIDRHSTVNSLERLSGQSKKVYRYQMKLLLEEYHSAHQYAQARKLQLYELYGGHHKNTRHALPGAFNHIWHSMKPILESCIHRVYKKQRPSKLQAAHTLLSEKMLLNRRRFPPRLIQHTGMQHLTQSMDEFRFLLQFFHGDRNALQGLPWLRMETTALNKCTPNGGGVVAAGGAIVQCLMPNMARDNQDADQNRVCQNSTREFLEQARELERMAELVELLRRQDGEWFQKYGQQLHSAVNDWINNIALPRLYNRHTHIWWLDRKKQFNGMAAGDLDLFVVARNARDAASVIDQTVSRVTANLRRSGTEFAMYRTERVVTIHSEMGRIQVITLWYQSVEELLLNFDLDPCRVAWDGEQVWATDSAFLSLATRTVYSSCMDSFYKARSSHRCLKYCKRGFDLITERPRFNRRYWGVNPVGNIANRIDKDSAITCQFSQHHRDNGLALMNCNCEQPGKQCEGPCPMDRCICHSHHSVINDVDTRHPYRRVDFSTRHWVDIMNVHAADGGAGHDRRNLFMMRVGTSSEARVDYRQVLNARDTTVVLNLPGDSYGQLYNCFQPVDDSNVEQVRKQLAEVERFYFLQRDALKSDDSDEPRCIRGPEALKDPLEAYFYAHVTCYRQSVEALNHPMNYIDFSQSSVPVGNSTMPPRIIAPPDLRPPSNRNKPKFSPILFIQSGEEVRSLFVNPDADKEKEEPADLVEVIASSIEQHSATQQYLDFYTQRFIPKNSIYYIYMHKKDLVF